MTRTPPIFLLPNELLLAVVQLLGLDDAFVLGLSCRFFHGIIRDNSICRVLLEKHAVFSPEYRALCRTGDYARALRVLAKRRLAVAAVQPFVAAVVVPPADRGNANANGNGNGNGNGIRSNTAARDALKHRHHLYVNRTLLYTTGGRVLRILPLAGTVRRETAVDVRVLLDQAVPASKGMKKYRFVPLHYAEGYACALYTHHQVRRVQPQQPQQPQQQQQPQPSQPESWLVLFEPATGWSTSRRLHAQNKLVVRGNRTYLVAGTYTGRNRAGRRAWVLLRYAFATRRWFDETICLDGVGTADVGHNLCFEIVGDHFYVLSNQALGSNADDESEGESNDDSEDDEGGEDDNDDSGSDTGDYDNVGSSYYYCCRFPLCDPAQRQVATKRSRWRRRHDEGALDHRWTALRLVLDEATGGLLAVESRKEWRRGGCCSRRTYYTTPLVFRSPTTTTATATETTTTTTVDSGGSGHGCTATFQQTPPSSSSPMVSSRNRSHSHRHRHRSRFFRLPQNVHPGDDAANMILLTLRECVGHAYFPASAGFLDLVDRAAAAGGSQASPRTTIRACRAIDRLYETKAVVTWPALPADDSHATARDRALRQVLNPVHKDHDHDHDDSEITVTWDDRTLVYAGGSGGGVVVVSFDPTLCLPGLARWHAVGGVGDDVGGGHECGEGILQGVQGSAAETGQGPSWASSVEPLYRQMGRGFDFSR
ncbi:f-box domain containing protein [Niveomyces insectorum RCEF 264]|uniref:F-box domain containing protein n=1 Tax=Niveomyces insectorum RCEF 264 TaxID=1081102 RepID=A0A167Q7D5_9HYPO|nr:f-box domain containing protein [Niveomyces insectorum RCEF 264]